MKELIIFENKDFGKIRSLKIENEPWFVVKDICDSLDLTNITETLKRLDEDELSNTEVIDSIGRKQRMYIVNESGLYNLILQSRKEEAKTFKRWITHEVIPSIRKNGGYLVGQDEMSEEELMAKAILFANKKIEQLKENNARLAIENSKLTVTNEIMRPKAEYFDDLVERNLLTNFRETAKELKIGQKEFIDTLMKRKFIYKDKKGKIQPYADKNCGYFEVKETKSILSNWVGIQTLITPKGRDYFRKMFMEV